MGLDTSIAGRYSAALIAAMKPPQAYARIFLLALLVLVVVFIVYLVAKDRSTGRGGAAARAAAPRTAWQLYQHSTNGHDAAALRALRAATETPRPSLVALLQDLLQRAKKNAREIGVQQQVPVADIG